MSIYKPVVLFDWYIRSALVLRPAYVLQRVSEFVRSFNAEIIAYSGRFLLNDKESYLQQCD